MMNLRHWGYCLLMGTVILLLVGVSDETSGKAASSKGSTVAVAELTKIDAWVARQMQKGGIPGAAVVIVRGNRTVYQKEFGYADLKNKQPVTAQTLFELGSTSKAFTGLGILKLERDGLIQLDDPVTKYLPWFRMSYTGEYRLQNRNSLVPITIEQLLHHTSGIPFRTIGLIPVSDRNDALEKTVKRLVNKSLEFYPGTKYHYATINYDILGLVIQKVTHMSYENYMKQQILDPLNLNRTFLFRKTALLPDLAVGYKIGFLRPLPYNAPRYRGNTPAGYYISNIEDMAKWLKIQLQTGIPSAFSEDLIIKSHIPDRSVAPREDAASYAAGWAIFQNGAGQISHGGDNPNYSSFIVFRPGEKLGVAVLANLDSANTPAIGEGIMDILQQKRPNDNVFDLYRSVDNIAVTMLCMLIPFILTNLWCLVHFWGEIFRKKRKFQPKHGSNLIRLVFLIALLGGLGYCIVQIPEVIFWGLSWNFVYVWAPLSFSVAIGALSAAIILFGVYYYLTTLFPKENEQSIFPVVTLSVASGIGNALIIFVVNEALNRTERFQTGLLLFFIMGIGLYIFGQRLVRIKLVALTNGLVYQKRIELIDRILHTHYQKFETIENEQIYSGLNNDTETISAFANVIITGATNLVTLVCCFIYLGVINIYGLLISILVMMVAAGLYFMVGQSANQIWEETRDIQNVFFKFIGDLVNGFKELSIHRGKRNDFRNDMQTCCDRYRIKKIRGDLSFANVFAVGELLFTMVIGVVAFVFPTLFKNIPNSALRAYIIVFLYMTGPVNDVLNAIPSFIQAKVSWTRLNKLFTQLKSVGNETNAVPAEVAPCQPVKIELVDVEYQYKNGDGDHFAVGPIDLTVSSGEIIFITGGNGSGKSTLVKLLTGLYLPDKGKILVNGQTVGSQELSQKYAAVFSDFYLFDKMYGLNYEAKRMAINKYLRKLRIDSKLEISDGVFSTTKLSSGQRKRLGLLISYLEDREVFIFDEWAADQEPEFRKYFYQQLLPELKSLGKCIIAITHDDRYFNMADRVVRMEIGKMQAIQMNAQIFG
jgi:putative ATP-binding cassette transporter